MRNNIWRVRKRRVRQREYVVLTEEGGWEARVFECERFTRMFGGPFLLYFFGFGNYFLRYWWSGWNISAVTFRFFENTNLVLLQGLVKSICKYWNQGGWPFSYIDLIADCGSKIFKLSDDVEIKTDVLFLITDLAIYYNRWYAMGIVRELFKDVRADVALQTNLAMRLSAEKLQLGVIFADEGALPPLIADIYKV